MQTHQLITEKELGLLEWKAIKKLFTSQCQSPMTRTRFDNLEPLPLDKASLRARQISELKRGIISNIKPELANLHPVGHLAERAEKGGILTLDELYQCLQSIRCTNGLISFFKIYVKEFPLLSYYASSLIELTDEEKILGESITDNLELNIGRYPHIGRLQQDISSLQQETRKKIQNLINSSTYRDHIQEKTPTSCANRHVMLIKASSKGHVKGTILDTSSSGNTFYFEPHEISHLNTKILEKENELNYELFLILKELSAGVGAAKSAIKSNIEHGVYIDFLQSAARVSHYQSWSEIRYVDEPTLLLYKAKHPLLLADNPEITIGNTIDLCEKRGMIITGANTGGKTVLLKTAAIAVLLAHYGFHIPAGPDSKVGPFSSIFIDIGDDQNITQSLSTFSGQVVALSAMLEKADNHSLIIIDEIISGTNPRHAAALAMSVLERFETAGSTVIASTHYPELKEFATNSSYYSNASVSFDIGSLKPTYHLQPGTPGTSYAFEIAKVYGLGEDILNTAQEHLSRNEVISEKTIENINKLEGELREKKTQAATLENSLNKQRDNYYKLNEKLRDKIANLKEDRTVDYIRELEKWREEIRSTINDKKELTEKELHNVNEKLSNELAKGWDKLETLKQNRYQDDFTDYDIDSAELGDRVFIISLEKEGTVIEVQKNKKEVLVSLGKTMKSRFKCSSLKLVARQSSEQQRSAPKQQKRTVISQEESEETVLTMQTSLNTIDLRGMRVEEALSKIDYCIDSMSKEGIEAAVIIHGHGTGALKSAVREWIKNSFYIKNSRPGMQEEGGDGVTIATL